MDSHVPIFFFNFVDLQFFIDQVRSIIPLGAIDNVTDVDILRSVMIQDFDEEEDSRQLAVYEGEAGTSRALITVDVDCIVAVAAVIVDAIGLFFAACGFWGVSAGATSAIGNGVARFLKSNVRFIRKLIVIAKRSLPRARKFGQVIATIITDISVKTLSDIIKESLSWSDYLILFGSILLQIAAVAATGGASIAINVAATGVALFNFITSLLKVPPACADPSTPAPVMLPSSPEPSTSIPTIIPTRPPSPSPTSSQPSPVALTTSTDMPPTSTLSTPEPPVVPPPLPTKSPSSEPSMMPSPAPTKPPNTGPTGGCNLVTIDFNTNGTVAEPGSPIDRGTYVNDQWLAKYGLELFAEGGLGTLPRIFDTAKPGDEAFGDVDLGSPNERCDPVNPGPGVGEGGEPGEPGENCVPQGNVLIVQEHNDNPDIPDDNRKGGIITLEFPCEGGQYVSEIGLMDIDYTASVTVMTEIETIIPVPRYGDNSVQTLEIDEPNVRWIDLMMKRSGAITHITFCPAECMAV